jgi:hypothetical protein
MDLGDLKFPNYSECADLYAYWQERAKAGDARAKEILELTRKIMAIGKSPIRTWPDVT